jgi:hypothetical protein
MMSLTPKSRARRISLGKAEASAKIELVELSLQYNSFMKVLFCFRWMPLQAEEPSIFILNISGDGFNKNELELASILINSFVCVHRAVNFFKLIYNFRLKNNCHVSMSLKDEIIMVLPQKNDDKPQIIASFWLSRISNVVG